ncbi:MAG: DUF86 domain-containing protein [candidate division KSB1 bacterium]|nr:DUF86 domain-containing protein [candidate division KSB1 bacterium]
MRLKKLRETIAKLETIRARGEEAYNNDDLLQSAAERALQIAVQCVLDIGNHIIAELSLPLPSDNDEIIDTLCKAGIISQELANRLAGIGGFRNVLLHDYLTLDPGRIFHEHLERLDDLRDFAAEIVHFLDELGKAHQQ